MRDLSKYKRANDLHYYENNPEWRKAVEETVDIVNDYIYDNYRNPSFLLSEIDLSNKEERRTAEYLTETFEEFQDMFPNKSYENIVKLSMIAAQYESSITDIVFKDEVYDKMISILRDCDRQI